MTFGQAIRVCFGKYADFKGTASRAEFWWWILFTALVSAGLGILGNAMVSTDVPNPLSGLWSIAVLLPTLAVGARRLHDTNKSGWLQLLLLLPCVGVIVLIVLWALPTTTPPAIGGDDTTPPAVAA